MYTGAGTEVTSLTVMPEDDVADACVGREFDDELPDRLTLSKFELVFVADALDAMFCDRFVLADTAMPVAVPEAVVVVVVAECRVHIESVAFVGAFD